MPTEQDRKARRVAEERLERSYGWPTPAPKLYGWRLAASWAGILVVDLAALGIVVGSVAWILGWRP